MPRRERKIKHKPLQGRKNPHKRLNPSGNKSTKASQNPESYRSKKPSWAFSYLRMSGPYSWENCDGDMLVNKILPRLKSLETMTWAQIIGPDHHHIPVHQICKDAQKCLQSQNNDDIDEVFSLRIEGRPRLFGILRDGVFRALWYDPEHKVCPSYKKGQKKKHN